MEKKIYFGGGLGSQILVMGQTGELLGDPDSYERVELPELPSAVEMKITSPVTFTPWHNENTNRKERRRLKRKAKTRFR